MAGWPSSTGNNTMSKRSASRQQQFSGYRPGVPSGVNPPFDSLIKDYTKKRWLILALLSVEVSVGVHLEMLINMTLKHPYLTHRQRNLAQSKFFIYLVDIVAMDY